MNGPIYGVQRLLYDDVWQWLNGDGKTTPYSYASLTTNRRDARRAVQDQNKLHPGEKHRVRRFYFRSARAL